MLAQKITFDLMQSKLDDIRVVQGDSCREIQFEGSDLEGVLSYDDYTYEFDLMKSDGTFVIQTLSAGILIPSEQMEVITGTHYYNVKIKDADNELVYSGQGAFIVDDNVITEEAIESVAEVNGLIFPDDFLTVNDHVAFIDDDTVSEDSTWSSQKIQNEIDMHSHVISKTVTGNPVTFTDGASAPLVKCDVTISPKQDLHGYTKPWVGGAGRNKFDKTTYTFTVERYISLSTGNVGTNNSYACTESYIPCSNLAGQTITLNHIPGGTQPGMAFYDSSNDYISGGKGEAITVPSTAVYYRFTVPVAYASGDDVQIEIGSTATTYEPYANICPITGYTDVDVNVATTTTDTPQTYTFNLGGTYYSGQIDAVKGVLVADKAKYVFDGSSDEQWYASGTFVGSMYIPSNEMSYKKLQSPFITNQAEYVDPTGVYTLGKCKNDSNPLSNSFSVWLTNNSSVSDFRTMLASNPLECLFELATPLEITLTPAVISSLLGDNAMWTDGDNLSVEYITAPYQPLIDSISQLI